MYRVLCSVRIGLTKINNNQTVSQQVMTNDKKQSRRKARDTNKKVGMVSTEVDDEDEEPTVEYDDDHSDATEEDY
jgi:hypothetical protein